MSTLHPKTTTIGIVIILLVVVAIGYYLYTFITQPLLPSAIASFPECANAGYPVVESFPRQCITHDGRTFVEEIHGKDIPTENGRIRISVPMTNATVASPLFFSGEADGTWYFEGSFPVELLDGKGRRLAQSIATAEREWMTDAFVPFSGTLSWSQIPETSSGTLRFRRDNPSGLPEHDAIVDIPVMFLNNGSTSGTTTDIVVFFVNTKHESENTDCGLVVPTPRHISISESPTIERMALEALLRGPTEKERDEGFETLIPEGVRINALTITNGVAQVDLSDAVSTNVAGSCRVRAIRAQIEATLKQFPTVNTVVIAIMGETETILQP